MDSRIITLSLLFSSFFAFTIPGALGDDCDNVLESMLSCLNYLQDRASSPPPECCAGFANVVNVSPQCLCDEDPNNSNFASHFQDDASQIYFNETRIISLPIVCNVDPTPVVNACQDNGGNGNGTGTGNGNGGTAGSTPGLSASGSSTKLPYFLMVATLPAILMYSIMSTAG